ncbi:MAG: energy-coupling factor transporter transmembrane protein EcfT [Clostridia bacterium]|nr:energy-coupling factor transporter transmembrane protein EcfT [Clostridia bacterium]
MFEQFHARRPVHPLAAFFCSLLSLAVGMVCAGSPWVFAYLTFLGAVYLTYGLYTALLYMTIGMGAFGIITGGITALMNGNLDRFWISPARCLVIGVCIVPMLAVPPALLIRCLNQMKLPRGVTLGMLITVRFLPTIWGEVSQIRAAMRTRGIDTRLNSFRWYRPSNLYRAFLIPLVMRTVNLSDTLSLSVETRGFDPAEREATVYHPVGFTRRDGIFVALTILAVAAMLAVRGGMGR